MADKTETSVQPPSKVEQDPVFYFSDVTFQVENSLFKVHRLPFQQGSKVFREMFQLPAPEGGVADGCDDDHPLHLEQIKKEDFKQFLRVLFPGSVIYEARCIVSWTSHSSRPYKQETLPATLAEWTSVLKLSTMWDFDVVRQNTIKQMFSMNLGCVRRAVLAIEYDIDEWLVPALNELARRKEPITLAEMAHMGAELTLKMAAVRENVTYDWNCLKLGERKAERIDFSPKIREVLGL
ncbi:hypothetical protein SERLA73DRAFT_190623 [Serpula lacrymans var. lacrymans S7.3]|uniref:BTB domain-containing protein n=2 Tax=Serpula lacrymans var. lacrymans TaxID=341189 RepID=F8QG22_SERL3|nr:uncharacterized protein SERLADRAFT_463497 [Serpula lacrymans var. lacrymans S7.9]EGN92770.1 hypothetical protein SERLA73DRAFT_190623 [Serpula lacrymans var. lacrymans S7.3]EGO26431.1 hypothetical protein SERLADRAFT_463497 [Serpula lacrymans var. lacrymans S7.9]